MDTLTRLNQKNFESIKILIGIFPSYYTFFEYLKHIYYTDNNLHISDSHLHIIKSFSSCKYKYYFDALNVTQKNFWKYLHTK